MNYNDVLILNCVAYSTITNFFADATVTAYPSHNWFVSFSSFSVYFSKNCFYNIYRFVTSLFSVLLYICHKINHIIFSTFTAKLK